MPVAMWNLPRHGQDGGSITGYDYISFTHDDVIMMTSSNGNISCATGTLWGESTGHQWIPLTKASDTELWSAPEKTHEQTTELPMFWDAIALIMT